MALREVDQKRWWSGTEKQQGDKTKIACGLTGKT
jgi:hypothetical protein